MRGSPRVGEVGKETQPLSLQHRDHRYSAHTKNDGETDTTDREKSALAFASVNNAGQARPAQGSSWSGPSLCVQEFDARRDSERVTGPWLGR